MKKILCFTLSLALILALCACTANEKNINSGGRQPTGSDYSASLSDYSAYSQAGDSQDWSGAGQQTQVGDHIALTESGLEGATISDTAFIEYYKNLGAYEYEPKAVANAKYASPKGNGEGTKEDPYDLQDAFDDLKAGDTLYLRGGTYTLTDADGLYLAAKGSADKYITIRNYPGEQPVIKNSYVGREAYAVQLDAGASYIVIEGIEITGVKSLTACGIAVYGSGQNHVIIRNCKLHDIKTDSPDPENDDEAGANGILLLGEKNEPISNFIIADNDIHDNVTGWSESLSVAGNCEYIYVLNNTVDNNTNIGVDFYGNAKYCKTPSLDQPRYCVAAYNKISRSKCNYADCAGLYVDGARDVILQYNEITGSQFGIEIGSEERNDDYPVTNVIVKNNVIKNNLVAGLRVGGYEQGDKTGYVKNTRIYNNVIQNNVAAGADGAEIIIAKCDGVSFEQNRVHASVGLPVATDFTAAVTKNVTFLNNVFSKTGKTANTVEFYIYGRTITGIAAFNDLFGENSYAAPQV